LSREGLVTNCIICMAACLNSITASVFIDESLRSFNAAQLRDVIRVAQGLLTAKSQQANRGFRHQWRFWDRPLQLDWSVGGLPKIQYPCRQSGGESEVDWKIFDFLKGSACKAMHVDWDILELLSPESEREACLEPEEEPDTNLLRVDWSGNRLPNVKMGPPQRRLGFSARVRTGSFHTPIKPRPRVNSKVEETPSVAAKLLSAPPRWPSPGPIMKSMFRPKPCAVYCTRRIQKPLGRH
jgi:hypothetical protein